MVALIVDGKVVQLAHDTDLTTPLVHVLNTQAHCQSVKIGCSEGGCGACAVQVWSKDAKGELCVKSINSCLTPVGSVLGKQAIVTASGLGNHKDGFHPVQERLAGFFASQCGFCTPGIAVACATTLEQQRAAGVDPCAHTLPTHALSGNLCRCTGYRPIVDTCKSFCTNADVEDLGIYCASPDTLPTTLTPPTPTPDTLTEASNTLRKRMGPLLDAAGPLVDAAGPPLDAAGPPMCGIPHGHHGTKRWVQPSTLHELLQVLSVYRGGAQVVAGNTGVGVYKNWPTEVPVVVDVCGVDVMQGVVWEEGGGLRVGGACTLAEWAIALQAGEHEGYTLLRNQLQRIAGMHVQHAATVGGNLMLARTRHFESDVLTPLLALGALVHVAYPGAHPTTTVTDASSTEATPLTNTAGEQVGTMHILPLCEFMTTTDTTPNTTPIIVAITIPPLLPHTRFWTYKLSERYTNSHSLVNAAIKVNTTHSVNNTNGSVNYTENDAHVCAAVGYHDSNGVWQCMRVAAVEDAIAVAATAATIGAAAVGVHDDVSHNGAHNGAANGYHTGTDDGNGHSKSTPAAAQHPPTTHNHQQSSSHVVQAMHKALRAVLEHTSHATPAVQQMTQGVLLKGLVHTLLLPHTKNTPSAPHTHTIHTHTLPPALAALVNDPDNLVNAPPTPARGSQTLAVMDDSTVPLGVAVQKDKSLLQASGEATYTGDIPAGVDALYGAFVLSSCACGSIESIDAEEALALPGVVTILTAKDVPGQNIVGSSLLPIDQEPLFAEGQVVYHGQPVGMILATSQDMAQRAARMVKVIMRENNGSLMQPVLDIETAKSRGLLHDLSFMGPMADWSIKRGDMEAALEAAPHVLKGTLHLPSCQHMYMEPQVSVARPQEGGGLWVATACQGPSVPHVAAARVLGVPQHRITMETRRTGGGFGGKVGRALFPMLAACVGVLTTGREVRVAVNRNDDMRMNGGRNPTQVEYTVAFDDQGVIAGVQLRITFLGSVYIDMSFIDPSACKEILDSCYAIPVWDVEMMMTKCNVHPFTTMRAPGHTQAAYIIQHLLHRVAVALGIDEARVHEVNMLNASHLITSVTGVRLYKTPASQSIVREDMYTAPRIWEQLKVSSRYAERRAAVEMFNKQHTWRKRGLSIMPTRFTPMITSQVGGVSVYHDGSVLVHHSGVEMGQGLTTKVKQVATLELSRVLPDGQHIPLDQVTTSPVNTTTLANQNITGGSGTSESTCQAVRLACASLVTRLTPIAEKLREEGHPVTWSSIIARAFIMSWAAPLTQLQTIDQYGGTVPGGAMGEGPPEKLQYCVFGAAVSEVEVDVLTGERHIVRSDVLFDVGKSMNPGVDVGQIEGAFVMGCGMALTEEALFDHHGKFLTDSTWNYKIPSATCIPREMHVQLLENSDNTRGIYSSKACGEPPLQLSATVMTALQDAVDAARRELDALSPEGSSNAVKAGGDWGPPATLTRLQEVMGARTAQLHTLLTM